MIRGSTCRMLLSLILMGGIWHCPAPLIYTPGEGWVYEAAGSEGAWKRTRAKDQLIIGKSARVDAEIETGELVVMGELRGKISQCKNRQIAEGGVVVGDINIETLDIKPGGIFEGNCAMMKRSQANKTKVAS